LKLYPPVCTACRQPPLGKGAKNSALTKAQRPINTKTIPPSLLCSATSLCTREACRIDSVRMEARQELSIARRFAKECRLLTPHPSPAVTASPQGEALPCSHRLQYHKVPLVKGRREVGSREACDCSNVESESETHKGVHISLNFVNKAMAWRGKTW